MAKQNLDHEFRLAKRRARQLGITLRALEGVSAMSGAYSFRPLNLIEFCLHEAAHLVTLGHTPEEFQQLRRMSGKTLSELVTERFALISPEAADQLEIDTARVTFVAGRRLRLWDDSPEPIMHSTEQNLSPGGSPDREQRVKEAFACLTLPYWHGWVKCDEQASLVAMWFMGRSL